MALLTGNAGGGLFGGAGGGSTIIIWIVVLVVFMFFFMIRPQRKEQQRKQDLMNRMAVGDTVLTTSGFYGTIIDIAEDTVIVEFGNNKNCRIPMQRAAIAQVEKAEDAIATEADENQKAEEQPKTGLFGRKK